MQGTTYIPATVGKGEGNITMYGLPEEKSLVALAVLVGALVLAATFTGAAAMRAR